MLTQYSRYCIFSLLLKGKKPLSQNRLKKERKEFEIKNPIL